MKKVLRRVMKWLAMLVVMAVALLAVAYLRSPTLSPDRLDAIENRVWDDAYLVAADSGLERVIADAESLDLPSVSIAAAVDGRVVWQAAIGWADIEARTGAGPETRYRTGSVAKPITALILGRLVAAGLIQLDAPVSTWVSQATGPVGTATPRQLAGHMGGVRHYIFKPSRTFMAEVAGRTHYATSTDALGLFISDPLLYPPGEGFEYSTHGYTLLGAALEGATGRPYLTLLEDEVVRPAGLKGTGPDDVTRTIPSRAVTYHRIADRYIDPPDADPSYKWAGGGLLSTPGDLASLAAQLMNHTLLDSAMVELLWTPQLMPDGSANPQNYGMGWRNALAVGMLGQSDTLRVLHHGGSSPGGNSFLVLIPSQRVAVAVMTNLGLRDSGPLRSDVYRIAGTFVRARQAAAVH